MNERWGADNPLVTRTRRDQSQRLDQQLKLSESLREGLDKQLKLSKALCESLDNLCEREEKQSDDIRRLSELAIYNMMEDFEVDIGQSVELYLEKKGYREIGDDLLFDSYSKVPYHVRPDKGEQAAVEWDAVVSAERGGNKFLFLVHVRNKVANVPACIERTTSFICMSAAKLLPSAGASWQEKESCRRWAWYSGHEMRGVVFAVDVIPDHALDLARENKLIIITASPDALHVEDPEEKETGTCTTLLRPWWGWHPAV